MRAGIGGGILRAVVWVVAAPFEIRLRYLLTRRGTPFTTISVVRELSCTQMPVQRRRTPAERPRSSPGEYYVPAHNRRIKARISVVRCIRVSMCVPC